jgi:transporter family-2 protein
MQILFYLAAGIFLGILFPIQASMSSRLSRYSKTPLTASFIAFALGSFVLLIINFIVEPSWLKGAVTLSAPLYVIVGGAIAGVGFNIANIILFSKLGASLTTLLTVSGQMLLGIIIDHAGLFGIASQPITINRILGVTIMIIAIFVSQKRNKNNLISAIKPNIDKQSVFWMFLGVVAGFLPPLQTAINSKLRLASGSLFTASFISFFVGMLLLIIILLLTEHRLSIPIFDEKRHRIPRWLYLGGIIGVAVVSGNIILLPILGSVLTTMVFLFGQITMAFIIDQLGLFNLPKKRIDLNKAITLLLMICGIVLVKF